MDSSPIRHPLHEEIDRLAELDGEAWWEEWARLMAEAPSVPDDPRPEKVRRRGPKAR
jgi:hypothetical protein